MADRTSPTVRRRRLGCELRLLREAAGLTGEAVAEQMSWSDSKVSRIETGKISVTWGDVSDLLDAYGVSDTAVRDALITLARQAKTQGWWHPYTDLLKRPYATYIGLEAAAEVLRVYEPLTIPGLLQTPGYARAVIATNTRELTDTEIERLIEVRLRRQEVVLSGDDPLRLHIILDEAALRRETGGPAVMHEQLERLVQAAAHPRTRLQVLTFEQGSHVGMAGNLTVFTFPDTDNAADVAFIDTGIGSLFVERRAEVQAARDTFDELTAQALSPQDTLALLTQISTAYQQRSTK